MLTDDLFSPEDFPYEYLISQTKYPWDILSLLSQKLSTHSFSGIRGSVEAGVTLKNPELIEIAEGCCVEAGAYIVGPCILGPHTIVRHGAYIRGGVITGEHCIIGHCTEMKNVYLGHYVQASHFAYVGDSVFSSCVHLGAGVRCANLRLDKANIQIDVNGQKIDTKLRKIGAFLGKHVSVGCNSVLNPGTCLEAYSVVGPGVVVSSSRSTGVKNLNLAS